MEGLSNKPLIERLFFETNTDISSLTHSDIEDIKQASQKLGEILVQKTPLPNQLNTFADQFFSIIIAIVTTVFALQLADEVFADENLNFRNFLKHLIISAGGAFTAFQLFKRGLITDKVDKEGKPLPSFRTLLQQKADHVKTRKPTKLLATGTVGLINIGSSASQAVRRGFSRISQRPEKTTSKTKLDQLSEAIEKSGKTADEFLAKQGNNLVDQCKTVIRSLKRK